ncbi:MAG: 2,4'-dihydroxyacetophenone dioxygenase family protein [Sphingomonadales bacterium]
MTPASLFRSEEDLPFVEMAQGISYQLLEVDFEKDIWVTRMRFYPGVSIPPHKHTGEVLAFTVSGAWKYREYPDTYRKGSYVHEPEGSTHTLEIPSENQGVTDIIFFNFGENINFDSGGKVDYVMDAKGILERYLIQCEVEGHPKPAVIGA